MAERDPVGAETTGDILNYCAQARRRLSELKYKLLQEAADWADANNATDHEKDVLKSFSEYFSKRVEEIFGHADSVEDISLRHALLLDITTAMMCANSLGNLGKESPFIMWREIAKNAARARPARQKRTVQRDRRRQMIKPIVLRDCEIHSDSWTAGERAARIFRTAARAMEENGLTVVSLETVTDDIKEILASNV